MNPGVEALDKLVRMGLFEKGSLPGSSAIQYWPVGRPKMPSSWANAAGLVHRASCWVGKRGLSVTTGRLASDVIYVYRPEEDQ